VAEKLKVGDRVDRVMVVAKKIKRDFSGGKFLLFQFSDREGVLKGVWWSPSEEADRNINADDVVRVEGDVQDYQGTLQLKVNHIEKVDRGDFDPSIFLPTSARDTGTIYEEILGIIDSTANPHIRALLQAIFRDGGFRERFLLAPAAKGWHHSYVGGLAEHIHDMLKMSLAAASVYDEVDGDLLVAGVLLHDLGKLDELSVGNHIDYSDKGRLLGHISMGVSFLDEYLRGMEGFPFELELRLKHMILSHHGLLEHGSPVVPMTLEALLLNYIDNMDAQVRGAAMVLEKSSGDNRWTDYVKLLDRFLYRGSVAGDEYSDNGGGMDG